MTGLVALCMVLQYSSGVRKSTPQVITLDEHLLIRLHCDFSPFVL